MSGDAGDETVFQTDPGVDSGYLNDPTTTPFVDSGGGAGGAGGGGFWNSLGSLWGGLGQRGSYGMMPGGQGGQAGGGGALGGLMQLLGLGLGAGGAASALFGGPGKQTQTPQMSGAQRDAMNAYRGNIAMQAPQQQAMFNQGAGLLQGLQQGQMPQGISNTVQAAYNPIMQQMGQNAIEASQQAGFALPQDAFTGGPGLRIMGNAMAQLPGQMAQTELNTMFPLISTLMGQGQQAVNNYGNAYNSFPTGQQSVQQPSMAQRFGSMGPFLQGIGSILNPPQMQLMLNNGGGAIPALGQQQSTG